MSPTSYAGTGQLVRQALRRDRVTASIWGVVLVGVCYASAAATAGLYPSTRDQVAAAEAINSTPAIVALYGPILDVHSLGELAMTKMTVLYAVFVAALFVVLVRRHTRSEEETGRAELAGSTAIGADAPLTAAVLEAALVALAIGVATAVVNWAGGLPLAGSIAFGASWTGIGLVAAGLGAVACQLSASSRTCGAIAASVLAVAYVLRAVGDSTSARWLSWSSPFGWATQLRSYSGTRWWVLLLYLALTAVLIVLAGRLRGRRDLGSGLLASRPGPAVAAPRLRGAISLAARAHEATLTLWTAGTLVLGAVLGAIVPNVSKLLDTTSAREMVVRLGGAGAVEKGLLAAELSVVAVAVTGFGIAAVAHAATDEQSGRTELTLAAGTARSRTLLATVLVALGGTLWLLLVTGLAVGSTYGLAEHDLTRGLREVVPAALVQAPAAWVVVALALALFATRTAWTAGAWVLLALFVTVGQVAELLDLPGWVVDLSPYSHTPTMPAGPFSAGPVLALLGAALLALVYAWQAHARRDIV